MNDSSQHHAHRLDRELNELLQELRVIQGGILLLVGFLLVIAFSPRFSTVGAFDKATYYLTLLVTGLAAIVVVAPVVHHRLAFRRRDKERVVVRGNRLILASIGLVALSILGIAVLVSHVLYGTWAVIAVTVAYVAVVSLFWVAMPLHSIRAAAREDHGD
jgi:O-antigen/teichoic acid export membrane protein